MLLRLLFFALSGDQPATEKLSKLASNDSCCWLVIISLLSCGHPLIDQLNSANATLKLANTNTKILMKTLITQKHHAVTAVIRMIAAAADTSSNTNINTLITATSSKMTVSKKKAQYYFSHTPAATIQQLRS